MPGRSRTPRPIRLLFTAPQVGEVYSLVFLVAIWTGHNYKVSTSVLGADGSNAPDGSRVGAWVLIYIGVVLAGINKSGCGTELDVLVVLAAELLCLEQNIATSATRTRHARHQVWVTESGVLWAKGCSIRVIKNLVFTFTSRRCRRQGPRDRLLARPGCAWSGTTVLLVLRLLCDGLEMRDFGLRGGVCGVALEPGLHVFDALLERLEFRGSVLNDLLSVVGGNGHVSYCALCSPH